MPVLLLGGTKDVIFKTGQLVARLEALLPALTVKVLPGAGHALIETTDHVVDFLQGQGAIPHAAHQ